MSKQIVKDAAHIEELKGANLPHHYTADECREFCERALFLLRYPEANPQRKESCHVL